MLVERFISNETNENDLLKQNSSINPIMQKSVDGLPPTEISTIFFKGILSFQLLFQLFRLFLIKSL